MNVFLVSYAEFFGHLEFFKRLVLCFTHWNEDGLKDDKIQQHKDDKIKTAQGWIL